MKPDVSTIKYCLVSSSGLPQQSFLIEINGIENCRLIVCRVRKSFSSGVCCRSATKSPEVVLKKPQSEKFSGKNPGSAAAFDDFSQVLNLASCHDFCTPPLKFKINFDILEFKQF